MNEPTACPQCGSQALVRLAGGFVCASCGWGRELLAGHRAATKRKHIKKLKVKD